MTSRHQRWCHWPTPPGRDTRGTSDAKPGVDGDFAKGCAVALLLSIPLWLFIYVVALAVSSIFS